jgi:16S rRNA (adenine1518-N6/adenine1519-N6)-dimethyltransferase
VRPRQSSTRLQGRRSGDPAAHPPARRRFGQNFLVDPSVVRRIVEALQAAPADTLVEIGPGRGILTAALLDTGAPVVAIEIDRDLAARLRERYDPGMLRLIEGDALDVSLASIATSLAVAGNLPYNISKPFAMKLVNERWSVARAVLMFQREVAMRLTARPGTGDYGPLTVLAGRAFTIERLFDVPPGAFRPRPKVVSTVTRWTPRPAADLPSDDVPALKSALRAAFAHRRQTIGKNLRQELSLDDRAVAGLLEDAGIDPGLRAEAVDPDTFLRLAAAMRRRAI